MNETPSTLSLLDAIREHLAAFDLPEPISVDVDRRPVTGFEQVTVHLSTMPLGNLASTLLTWADTFVDVRAMAWRPPAGDSVHLSVHGQLTDGTTIRVYSGVSFDGNRFSLEPGTKSQLTLGILRQWVAVDHEGVAA